MVVLCHEQGKAILGIKATSNIAPYINVPERLPGVILYRPRETCFEKATVVEPHNFHVVFYGDIIREIGALPNDFPARLRKAIENSVDLNESDRTILLSKLT